MGPEYSGANCVCRSPSLTKVTKHGHHGLVNGLPTLVTSWRRHLVARNLSPHTIDGYQRTARFFIEYLEDNDLPLTACDITREHVEAFITEVPQTRSSATAATRYRDLKQLFRWLDEEDEIPESPMQRMRPPQIDEKPVPIVSVDDLKALIDVCKGKGFEERRDRALILLFIDTGLRLSEVANLTVDDVDLDYWQAVRVLAKSRRERAVSMSPKVVEALDRYLRIRISHSKVGIDWLWLGGKGRLTGSGIAQMLKRRSAEAGIDAVHPHQLRHTSVHYFLLAGGNEGDAMCLFGWKSRQMLDRYAALAADELARETHKLLSPVEGLL